MPKITLLQFAAVAQQTVTETTEEQRDAIQKLGFGDIKDMNEHEREVAVFDASKHVIKNCRCLAASLPKLSHDLLGEDYIEAVRDWVQSNRERYASGVDVKTPELLHAR